MADNTFLQAFQTGASLYDKAQSRKMEQAQMEQQVANFALQKEHQALQQQLGNLQLAKDGFALQEAKSEAAAQAEDSVPFNEFVNRTIKYSDDPSYSEDMIQFPNLKSQKLKSEALGILKEAVIKRNNQVAARASLLNDRVAAVEKKSALDGLDWLSKNVSDQAQFVHEMSQKLAAGTTDWDAFSQIKAKVNQFAPALTVTKTMPQGENRALATAAAQQGGTITPEMMKRSEGQSYTDANRKSKNHFNLLTQNFNIPLDENDLKELDVAFQNGAQKIGQKVVDEINFGNQLVRTMESDHQMIVDFDKKYGQGAFDEYVGPIDKPVFDLKARVSKLPQASQEAKNIQDQVLQHLQSYRKANFGTALSESEQAVFKEFSPDPNKPVFAASILNFAKGARKATEIMVSKNWKSPQITQFQEEYFKPEFKRGIVGKVGASATPAATPSEGISVPLNGGTFIIKRKQ